MEPGNASVAVIDAGDYINRATARKFASQGFVVFVGRRRGDKLAPLVAEVEAAGGRISGRSLDAGKEGGPEPVPAGRRQDCALSGRIETANW
ncbi:MAG TPA: hypothetical protein VGI28_15755 [Stellaceae bacterium]